MQLVWLCFVVGILERMDKIMIVLHGMGEVLGCQIGRVCGGV